jgi:hypothetical protein
VATKQRSRNRRSNSRSSSRDRQERYVAPVLDPNWQSPYQPSAHERQANQHAVRAYALRRRLPFSIAAVVVVGALCAGFVAVVWLPAVGVVVAALYLWDLHRYLAGFDKRGHALVVSLIDRFKTGGTTEDRQRLGIVLDRLSATFGVNGVVALIVEDPGYNAALVPDGAKYSLFVTSSLMSDFELIELEGVVAHLLARERLGLLARESIASAMAMNDESRRALAGSASAYRADEVAAAAIRYPLGLAGALRKCAAQVVAADSYFRSADYAQSRWIWFNIWSDRDRSDLADLDDAELRALALEEW